MFQVQGKAGPKGWVSLGCYFESKTQCDFEDISEARAHIGSGNFSNMRILDLDTLKVYPVVEPPAPTTTDFLDSEEFYAAMQACCHFSISTPLDTNMKFEAVKSLIRKNYLLQNKQPFIKVRAWDAGSVNANAYQHRIPTWLKC